MMPRKPMSFFEANGYELLENFILKGDLEI